MEVIGILLAFFGTYIAYITYKKTFPNKPPEPKEEKDNLLANYKITQKLSLEVQDLILQYIEKGNGDKEMYPNITFSQFLVVAKSEFDKSLSNELYDNLSKGSFTKSNIETMLRMIETQNNSLTELRNQMIMLNFN